MAVIVYFMARITREKWKVFENVFDEFTLRTIFKLSSQGHYIELESPVFIGKESNVFTAKADNSKGRIIVKIYRLETCDFNKMYDYIRYDPRYSRLRKQKRKIIFAWTQREFRNLAKAREAGVNVPTPITFLNNILLEEFIGDNEIAIRIKDNPPKKPKMFYELVILNMKKLHSAGLVHGDLSEYNILNYKEEPVFIDFSQCTELRAPNAEELIERDASNIARFFNKLGVQTNKEQIIETIKNG